MRKLIFLSISILGITTAANASWIRWDPSTWINGGTTWIVICHNTNAPRCMEYEGVSKFPQAGQRVKIYNNYEMVGYGRVINYMMDPGANDGANINELNGSPTMVELEFENSSNLSN